LPSLLLLSLLLSLPVLLLSSRRDLLFAVAVALAVVVACPFVVIP
jgi:hypothetical protein